MQRRDFVIATGSVLATGGAAAATAATAPSAATLPRPALFSVPAGVPQLRAATFQGLLNQSFNLYQHARGVSLQLTEVRMEKESPGTEQFTLVFSAPGLELPNGTYELEQGSIGQTSMYLKRGETGGDVYLAHFSLLV